MYSHDECEMIRSHAMNQQHRTVNDNHELIKQLNVEYNAETIFMNLTRKSDFITNSD